MVIAIIQLFWCVLPELEFDYIIWNPISINQIEKFKKYKTYVFFFGETGGEFSTRSNKYTR